MMSYLFLKYLLSLTFKVTLHKNGKKNPTKLWMQVINYLIKNPSWSTRCVIFLHLF